MTDRHTPEQRSYNMARIRSKNTKPELIVRSTLHKMGYRFRLHAKELPGKPDIVLKKHHAVIFVHGCFWHRHPGCKYAYIPKSRQEFWTDKFRDNIARHESVAEKLRYLGWNVHVVWECEISDVNKLQERLVLLLEGDP